MHLTTGPAARLQHGTQALPGRTSAADHTRKVPAKNVRQAQQAPQSRPVDRWKQREYRQGTATYEAAPHGTKHDSSKQLGGTSAGRALLRKKVNGFADMVQWVEDLPQDPQAVSQYAASQNQGTKARVQMQAKQPRSSRATSQGRTAGMAQHRMQPTSNAPTQPQNYNNKPHSDKQVGNSSRLSQPPSSQLTATQDPYLQRLQAAASAWRSASQLAASPQQALGSSKPMATPSQPPAEAYRQNVKQTAENITTGGQYSASSQLQQAQMPTPQWQNAQSPVLLAEEPHSHYLPASSFGAAAKQWSSPDEIHKPDFAKPDRQDSTVRPPMRTWFESDSSLASESQAMSNTEVGGQDGPWRVQAREPCLYDNDEHASASIVRTGDLWPPPPPPMPSNYGKPKASWWAALKGEAPPWAL